MAEVVKYLSSLAAPELAVFLGFDRLKGNLDSKFSAVKATLQDAEEKQFSDRAIKDWLQKLKDAAYELDEIMDECAYEELRLEYEEVKCCLSEMVLSSSLSSFHPKYAIPRYQIAKKMKRICERLDDIANERQQLHLIEMAPERKTGVPEWRKTISSTAEPRVYGRKEDTERIIDFLIGDADASHSENLSVYPILGQGGLGKTTLAQLIFKHERVVNHFHELRIWVCVSEDFSLKRMMKAIIEATFGQPCGDLDLEPLHRKLQDLLRSKKYLLVLDDVWDDDLNNWQMLKSVLDCGAKGASILVTTRLNTVAEIMGTTSAHKLSLLSNNECLELFKNAAFRPNEAEQPKLMAIGKEIVKKCGGVPLAAKAVGGLLRFKRNENQWLNVLESNLLELSDDENSIMPVLRLSYLNLPIELRKCFAYCAIFPKDEKIEKQYLIELWMANGFIQSNGRLDAEDVGDDVWNELHSRSFFQDIETDPFGRVISFKLHDLFHDLAQFVAEDICCITNKMGSTTLSERIHHFSDHRQSSNLCDLAEDSRDIMQKIGSMTLSKRIFLYTGHGQCFNWHDLAEDSFCIAKKNGSTTLSERIHHFSDQRRKFILHDLAQSVPDHIHNIINKIGATTWSENICQCISDQMQKSPEAIKSFGHLHIYNILQPCCRQLSAHVLECNSLRVLHCGLIKELPPSVDQLKYLKYLNLSRGLFKTLPESLCKLWNLQILKLDGCRHLKKLPDKLICLKALKQLSLIGCDSLSILPPHIGKLTYLRKLTTYFVGKERGFLLAELGPLKLKGYLGIMHLERVTSVMDAKESNMLSKQLNELKLSWHNNEESELPENVEQILEVLEPDTQQLQSLTVEGYKGSHFPQWISSSPSLKELRIVDCCKFNVSAGFQCLMNLSIESCGEREVEGLHEALQHMTSLKKLELRDLPKLESLPDCIGNLPLLQGLVISKCPKLRCLPKSLMLSSQINVLVSDCLELQKRFQKGEDCTKIYVQSEV